LKEFEGLPPRNIEVEKKVLGAAMQSEESAAIVMSEIESEVVFYESNHQKIFAAIFRIYSLSFPVNVLTVAIELQKIRQLDEIGGNYYLTELTSLYSSAAHIEYECSILKELYAKRLLIATGMEIQQAAYDNVRSLNEILGDAQNRLFQIDCGDKKRGFMNAGEVFTKELERIENAIQAKNRGETYNPFSGVETGFKDVDALAGGLPNSNLIIIAGRPSHGKTAFTLNVTKRICITKNIPIGYFSLEMTREELTNRLICDMTSIEYKRLTQADLTKDEVVNVINAWKKINNANFFIDDSTGLTAFDIRVRAQKLVKKHGIKIFFVDHLDWVRAHDRFENQNIKLGAITKVLKSTAKEIGIPFVVLHQLSRAVEKERRRPELGDLRESGHIEQDADIVMFVYRPEFNDGIESNSSTEPIEIIIRKWRNGPLALLRYLYLKKYMRFAEIANHYQEPPSTNGMAKTHDQMNGYIPEPHWENGTPF
jgi:replicative DNA helicase